MKISRDALDTQEDSSYEMEEEVENQIYYDIEELLKRYDSELQVNDYTVVRNFIDQERAIKLGYEFMRFCEEYDVAGDNHTVNSNSVHNYLPFF